MVNRRNRWLAVLAGTALALGMTATVFAVSGQLAGFITVSGPSGTLTCGDDLPVIATVLDENGGPIAGQPVDWSFSSPPSAEDVIGPSISTDASGVAPITVTLDNVPGPRTLTATADGISANAVINCAAGAVAGITAPGPITAPGLPRTSTTQDGSPVGNLPIATILALLAVLAGGGIIVRRFAVSPR